MDALTLLASRAAAMRIKSAGSTDNKLPGPSQLGAGLAGAASLGGAAHIARSGARAAVPSYLDLGAQHWLSPENVATHATHIGDEAAQQVHSLAKSSPMKFKMMLLGRDVGGIAPDIQEKVRDLTFRNKATFSPDVGDVAVSSFRNSTQQMSPAVHQMATGGGWHHADIGGKGGYFGIGFDPAANTPAAEAYSPDYATSPELNDVVRLKSKAPMDIKKVSDSIEGLQSEVDTRSLKYNNRTLRTLAAREVLPELNTREGSWLSRLMESDFSKRLASKFLGKSHAMASPYCEGNVCSTAVGHVLSRGNPEVFNSALTTTPNSLVRNVGKNFDVAGMHLSEASLARAALLRQHLRKFGPLAMRMPLIGALGAGGIYGLSKLFSGSGANKGAEDTFAKTAGLKEVLRDTFRGLLKSPFAAGREASEALTQRAAPRLNAMIRQSEIAHNEYKSLLPQLYETADRFPNKRLDSLPFFDRFTSAENDARKLLLGAKAHANHTIGEVGREGLNASIKQLARQGVAGGAATLLGTAGLGTAGKLLGSGQQEKIAGLPSFLRKALPWAGGAVGLGGLAAAFHPVMFGSKTEKPMYPAQEKIWHPDVNRENIMQNFENNAYNDRRQDFIDKLFPKTT